MPDWVVTTDPDRATNPDLKETLVPLDLAADADPNEKTRLFQTGLAWYVCAPGLHQPGKTTQDTLYPILLTIAGSAAAIKASRSNFLLDAFARVHPADQPVQRDHVRLDLTPTRAYRWHQSTLTFPGQDRIETVLTADMAEFFDRDPGVQAQRLQFCLALPPWRHQQLLTELHAQPALANAILAHAEAYGLLHSSPASTPWPATAPRLSADELLAQVPLALEIGDYLQRRTFRPLAQAAPFRVQLYFEACRQGLLSHARPMSPQPLEQDLTRWHDPATPLDSPSAENPTAWAQHPGALGLTLHTAFPPAYRPAVVAGSIAQADFDRFLLDQVTAAYTLNPALLAAPPLL